MSNVAAGLGAPSFAVISLRHPAVRVATAVMMAATICLLVVRLPARRRWIMVLPLIVGWATVGGILTVHAILTRDEISVSYLEPSSVSESLVLVSGNRGWICDLSNGSLSAFSASAREAEMLGATEVSDIVLTHYHTRTSGAMVKLLERETVRTLWMPRPADEAEYYLMLACLEKAEDALVPVVLYDYGDRLPIFGEGWMTVERAALERSSHPALMVELDVSASETGKDRLLYCGSAVFESELAAQAVSKIQAADAVIFGSHGPLIHRGYGDGWRLNSAQEIVFSHHRDVSAWIVPAALADKPKLWQGPWRTVLQRS
jgi:hypothetical protein